jgi:2-polyprenyl-6-methoxyphenol hydroxylase-like FAD-dependent oxidoreductase
MTILRACSVLSYAQLYVLLYHMCVYTRARCNMTDACHAVTPNNGQGACMAIEDAFVLAVLLRQYWHQPDGHVEAFYQ